MRTEIDIREKALGNYRVVDPGEAAPRARAGLRLSAFIYALSVWRRDNRYCAPAAPPRAPIENVCVRGRGARAKQKQMLLWTFATSR